MSKVSDADVEVAALALERELGPQHMDFTILARAALEAVSSIHEAEPEAEPEAGNMFSFGAREDVAVMPTSDSPTPVYLRTAFEIEQGRKASAPISKGVTVKALEWEHWKQYARWRSLTILGEYYIHRTKKGFEWFTRAGGNLHTCKTLPEAKAAAQADFDARILSCLSHTAGEIE